MQNTSTTLVSVADLMQLREKYEHERQRRARSDGARQYERADGRFGYYATDPYTERRQREPIRDTVEALVVGAGFGGLLAAAFLRDEGVQSLRLLDEAGDVGGTWYWNRYPGVRCDIESYVYMPLLEETGYMPSERYAPGEEIRQHAVRIAERYDLYQDFLAHTRVTELTWDEERNVWDVATDRGDRFSARFVITSSGTLSTPKLPGIPGVDTFEGHTFHTSRWDFGYTGGSPDGALEKLRDKRVGIVGTGATGLQVVPHLAESAAELFVFQRTPSSVDVRDNRPTDPEWAAKLEPGWQAKRMDNFLRVLAGEPVDEVLVTDGWTQTTSLQRMFLSGADEEDDLDQHALSVELEDARTMNRLRARVDEIVEDPATADALKPWYRYMCKRPGFSDVYLQAFNRSHVHLVDTADTHGITALTPNAVRVGANEYEVDCLIFATGFEAGVSGVVSGTLPVKGRDGRSLLDTWKSGPRTLHGFTTYGFPNLFQLSPYQNANSVNFVHILQEQARHIAAVIGRARQEGVVRVEPTAQAEADWIRTVELTARDNSSFLAECTPGYYNGEGTSRATSSYAPGPVAFHALLQSWRDGDMRDLFVRDDADIRAREVGAHEGVSV